MEGQPMALGETNLSPKMLTDYAVQLDNLVNNLATDFENKAKQVRIFGKMMPRQITPEQFNATWVMIQGFATRNAR